jgi:hypothetical protein
MKSIGRTLIFAVVIACASGSMSYGQDLAKATEVKKWEYKVLLRSKVFEAIHRARTKKTDETVTTATFEKMLNELGAKGWELVSAGNNSLIFKRPKVK